jgi:hypothetical protein
MAVNSGVSKIPPLAADLFADRNGNLLLMQRTGLQPHAHDLQTLAHHYNHLAHGHNPLAHDIQTLAQRYNRLAHSCISLAHHLQTLAHGYIRLAHWLQVPAHGFLQVNSFSFHPPH